MPRFVHCYFLTVKMLDITMLSLVVNIPSFRQFLICSYVLKTNLLNQSLKHYSTAGIWKTTNVSTYYLFALLLAIRQRCSLPGSHGFSSPFYYFPYTSYKAKNQHFRFGSRLCSFPRFLVQPRVGGAFLPRGHHLHLPPPPIKILLSPRGLKCVSGPF